MLGKFINRISDYKILALNFSVLISGQATNWQELGVCGVPSVQPHYDIFASTYEQSQLAKNLMTDNGRNGLNEKTSKKAKRQFKNYMERRLTRIVGGIEAKEHSWPWQVYVNHGYDCGGALVAHNWVITAAHCIDLSNKKPWVKVGLHSFEKRDEEDIYFGDKIYVKQAVVHPKYNSKTFEYDMALLELKESAIKPGNTNIKTVSPICLPSTTTCVSDDTPCVVTGWGINDTSSWTRGSRLQEVAVRIINPTQCTKHSQTYKYYFKEESMMCAGWDKGGKDACAGDSGGPLVCRVKDESGQYSNQWVLYGLVSWGLGCAKAGQPGVYTHVPKLSDWAFSVINTSTSVDYTADPKLDFNGVCENWNASLEENWKDNAQNIFPQLGPALTISQELAIQDTVKEEEPLNRCDIDFPSNEEVANMELGAKPFIVTGGERSYFTYGKQTLLECSYPRNQKCSISYTNTDPNAKLVVTVEAAKIDCRGSSTKRKDVEKGDALYIETPNYDNGNGDGKFCIVKSSHVKMIDPALINIKFNSDIFRTTDSYGFDMARQKYDGGFQLSIKKAYKYNDCKVALSKDGRKQDIETVSSYTVNEGEQYIVYSPNYPQEYNSDSQCRIFFQSSDYNLKLHYKISRMTTVKRGTVCSLMNSDNLTWLEAESCEDHDISFTEDNFMNIITYRCGKHNKKIDKRTNHKIGSDKACFLFAARGKTKGDNLVNKGFYFSVSVHKIE